MTDIRDQRDRRREYDAASLRRADLAADPVAQFERWFAAALEAETIEPTAMTLATATAAGRPSARIVLMKHFDADGLCWYTDSRSRKGAELADNPHAALLFHWPGAERQVRIEGTVERLPPNLADRYFNSRPEASRYSAAASVQSSVVAGRDVLESRVAELRLAHPDGGVARPEAWIGYRLRPGRFEFWQGRVNRLHDRFEYRRDAKGWQVERLSP
ncbi:MAG: pyridoxamine 5'-phosphate oxidase [Chromatiales bacterium]|nr:pyridoxamine 5'-phosphate oxidase [Chromatiales bacterium]